MEIGKISGTGSGRPDQNSKTKTNNDKQKQTGPSSSQKETKRTKDLPFGGPAKNLEQPG